MLTDRLIRKALLRGTEVTIVDKSDPETEITELNVINICRVGVSGMRTTVLRMLIEPELYEACIEETEELLKRYGYEHLVVMGCGRYQPTTVVHLDGLP